MARQPIPIAGNPTKDLSERITACKNPEFAQWLRELWQEAAQREGNKLQYVYKRAMDSMILHPESIMDPKEARKVAYVGPGIVARLEKRLEKFLADGGKLIHADVAAQASSQPMVRILPVLLPEIPAASQGNTQANTQGTTPGNTRPNVVAARAPKKDKVARPYVPSYRSGPYAMLIALFIEAQSKDSKGYCFRQDIVSLGQPYCSAPMEEGTFSALKGAIKKLEEKQLVNKWGNPARYALTDDGTELAQRLWNSGERRSSAPIGELQIPRTQTDPNASSSLAMLIDNSDDESEAVGSLNTAEPVLMLFEWPPGTYDIKLLIDNREVKSRTERDYLFQALSSAGVPIEQKALELGDFLWIAKRKQEFRTGGHDDLEEVVLDLIIERKTEDDLLHSIVDGRFTEQKFRLNSSGITNRIYLLEKYEGADFSGIGENKYRAAVVHTQVLDNLFLRYTQNLEESIKFIVAMHKDLIEKHLTRSIRFALQTDTDNIRRAQFLASLQRKSQENRCRYLMTYTCYSQINSKSANQTLRDLFLRQLMTIKHMSADKAALIADQYQTPVSLYEMYARLPDDVTRINVFKEWNVPGQTKKFGPMLSTRICETFWSTTNT